MSLPTERHWRRSHRSLCATPSHTLPVFKKAVGYQVRVWRKKARPPPLQHLRTDYWYLRTGIATTVPAVPVVRFRQCQPCQPSNPKPHNTPSSLHFEPLPVPTVRSPHTWSQSIAPWYPYLLVKNHLLLT